MGFPSLRSDVDHASFLQYLPPHGFPLDKLEYISSVLFNGLVYFNLNSKRVQDDISSKIVQAVQANVSLKNINDIQLVVPSDEVLDSWNEVSKPILDKMLIVQEQNIALKKIRDRLLPRLITGKIQLSDANQELKEAV